ncbi:DUF6341 family protein [Pseudofulvibacter geojedonensis]|uniref:Uracil phosphoribosyltransferase n=1 Tax=Pseudofulvibacter geojedonensis TaxID=1123758 RepID=A0ABW3I482_9FLAO
MTDLVYAIQDLFMALLAPMGDMAKLELENWWAANTINWILTLIGFVAILYWLKQLKIFNEEGKERRDIVSHSFFE